jgi:hypothetical protein
MQHSRKAKNSREEMLVIAWTPASAGKPAARGAANAVRTRKDSKKSLK